MAIGSRPFFPFSLHHTHVVSSSSLNRSTRIKGSKSACMDATHWPQEIGLMKPIPSSSMEELIMVPSSSTTSSNITRAPQLIEKRTRPNKELALHCPRCKSTNTKFCYYNNYSLTQPRYFCKTCRRYWTEGGSLRNVPVGGGSRKNKKSTTNAASGTSPLSSSSSANVKKLADLTTQVMNPNFNEGKDLNLSFYSNNSINNSSARPFVPAQEAAAGAVLYPSGEGFGLPSFISTSVNLHIDANIQEGGGRLMFPFEDLTQISPAFEQNRGQGTNNSSGFWNGVMGGGTAW